MFRPSRIKQGKHRVQQHFVGVSQINSDQKSSYCTLHRREERSRPLRHSLDHSDVQTQYNLTPAWHTLINFDTDIFFFDVRWTGFPLSQHVCEKPLPEVLMLGYPGYAAKTKNLAVVDEFLGTGFTMSMFTGQNFNTFLDYNQYVEPQFKSVEKIFIVGSTTHCKYALSIDGLGCRHWELGQVRYVAGRRVGVRPNPYIMAEKEERWRALPRVVDCEGKRRRAPVFAECVEVVCLHKEWERRCRDLRINFIPQLE